MTKQVEELTRGEALTRVAVLEAELAELRKRVCVPDGYKVVPVEPTPEMLGATSWPGCAATDYKHMLAAAHAPVEWVEHDHDAIALKKTRDIMQIMYGEMPKGGSTQLLAMVQECVLEAMSHVCTPQPTPTTAQDVEDPWKASGVEYDRAIHHNPDAKAWADLFVRTFPAQADQHDLMLGWFSNAMMAMHDWLKTKESPAPTAAQDVAGPTMLELLEKIDAVRMGDEESAHHVHGAAYWNNAVVACLDAVRKAHHSGGAKL